MKTFLLLQLEDGGVPASLVGGCCVSSPQLEDKGTYPKMFIFVLLEEYKFNSQFQYYVHISAIQSKMAVWANTKAKLDTSNFRSIAKGCLDIMLTLIW